MLDIPTREISSPKRNTDAKQVKRSVGAASFEFKPEPGKIVEGQLHRISAMPGSSMDPQNPADDVLIIKNNIVEDSTSWDVRKVSSKDDGGFLLCSAYKSCMGLMIWKGSLMIDLFKDMTKIRWHH